MQINNASDNYKTHNIIDKNCWICKYNIYILNQFTCNDAVVKTLSHKKWVVIDDSKPFQLNLPYEIFGYYKCEICGLYALKINDLYVFWNCFYTCNEYLMIRANE